MSRRILGDGFDSFKEHDGVAEFGGLDEIYRNMVSQTYVASSDENIATFLNEMSQDSQLIKPVEENPYAFPSASLKILRRCRRRVVALKGGNVELESPSTLSASDIIELAASFFVQSNSKNGNQLSAISHPFATSYAKDIQLVQDLLLCAEKVSNQDYDSATEILEECQNLSLTRTNVVQRLVYYFTEALCDKIERENGRSFKEGMIDSWPVDVAMAPSSALATFHEKIPFNQITQFTSIQLMDDHLSGCTRIHIVDLEVYAGLHHSILMQTLADRSELRLEHFKITAVVSFSNALTEEAGVRLRTLAESLNLSFSFLVISLDDFLNPESNLFEPDCEETVIVHAAFALKHMIAKPGKLERLMRAISSINPSVMIVQELEANVNSPVFVNRFVEALFFNGAYFDCMEDFLKDDGDVRAFAESELFRPPLRNSVAAEGDERKFRIVSIDVWRVFFERFGMVETELSELALDNANFVVKRFDCKGSCTLGLNGKSLVVSWKETPICSISAWKFRRVLSINITT